MESVSWCTTADVRQALERALTTPVTWTTPEDPFAGHLLAVLDTRAFAGTGALLEVRRQRPESVVLVLCKPDEISELVGELGPVDDLALHETPLPLLAFRLGRLVAVSGRDSLTGLYQRSVLFESLQWAIVDPARLPLSLLIIDVDGFKKINDMGGHEIGDDTLRQAAQCIVRSAPPGASVARLGGDEFAVLHGMGAAEALEASERIRSELRTVPIHGFDLTVSIGSATARHPGAKLFTPADEALYAAKARGGDCAVHYDDLARRARAENRDPALESFENRTRVIAQRVAEVIAQRGRKLFGELKEQADVDALTGLFSRRYLDRRLPFELEVSTDEETPLTIALLDIDHFGVVNKSHGWPTGDTVLKEVASRIRRSTRSGDWSARYGGEEVCIVMHATPLAAARPVLERVRAAVEGEPFQTTSGQGIVVTVSGGAAEREGNESLASLLERVSWNLLAAKRGGRNRIVT